MSRRGNCYDNALAEGFFQLLKRERIRRRVYATRAETSSITSRCSTTRLDGTAIARAYHR